MADLVFNCSKGRVAYHAELSKSNDALVLVPLQASGLGSDAILRRSRTLAQVLANATEHSMGRKSVTSASVSIDDTNDRCDVDISDQTWVGATGNPIGAVVICYDPDTTLGDDNTRLIPLTKHDFPVTPNGSDIVAQVSTTGFYRAS